jgi:hypothetical protein
MARQDRPAATRSTGSAARPGSRGGEVRGIHGEDVGRVGQLGVPSQRIRVLRERPGAHGLVSRGIAEAGSPAGASSGEPCEPAAHVADGAFGPVAVPGEDVLEALTGAGQADQGALMFLAGVPDRFDAAEV